MFIKAVFRAGHVGKGKYYEMARYMQVENITEALIIARTMPRVKKKRGLISCKEISFSEYLEGKELELNDPYINSCPA